MYHMCLRCPDFYCGGCLDGSSICQACWHAAAQEEAAPPDAAAGGQDVLGGELNQAGDAAQPAAAGAPALGDQLNQAVDAADQEDEHRAIDMDPTARR